MMLHCNPAFPAPIIKSHFPKEVMAKAIEGTFRDYYEDVLPYSVAAAPCPAHDGCVPPAPVAA